MDLRANFATLDQTLKTPRMNQPANYSNFNATKNRKETRGIPSRQHYWSSDYQSDTGDDIGESEPPPNNPENGCPKGPTHLATIQIDLNCFWSPAPVRRLGVQIAYVGRKPSNCSAPSTGGTQ
jgi:hypothetical protein